VLELSIYVDRGARGSGVGRALGEAILSAAEPAGAWKVIGKLSWRRARISSSKRAGRVSYRRHSRRHDELMIRTSR
jgi:L-amino acid N-acyltransferase YncA